MHGWGGDGGRAGKLATLQDAGDRAATIIVPAWSALTGRVRQKYLQTFWEHLGGMHLLAAHDNLEEAMPQRNVRSVKIGQRGET